MQTTPPLFTADSSWLDLARHGLRQIGLAVALPVALYLVFKTPLSGVLTVTAVGVGLTALLTRGRLSWGRAIAFHADGGVRVVRRDGSTLEIPASDVQLIRVKNDCFALAWRDAGKRRSFVVGQEGFLRTTWTQLHAAAQARAQSAA